MRYVSGLFCDRRETCVSRGLRFRPFLRPARDPRIAQLEHPTDGAHLLLARNPVSRKLRFGHFLRHARDSRLAWVTFASLFAPGERLVSRVGYVCATFRARREIRHLAERALCVSRASRPSYVGGGPPTAGRASTIFCIGEGLLLGRAARLTWERRSHMGPSAFHGTVSLPGGRNFRLT